VNLGLATRRPALTGESLHSLGEQFALLSSRLVTVLGISDGFIFGTNRLLLLLVSARLDDWSRSGKTMYLSMGSRGRRWSIGVTGITWSPRIASLSLAVEQFSMLCSSAVLTDDPVTSRSTPHAPIMLSVSRTDPMNAWSRVFSGESSIVKEPTLSFDTWCISWRFISTSSIQSSLCFV